MCQKNCSITKIPHMLHGADYNPDQWLHDPKVLTEDLRLMQKTETNTVTLGIFAWSSYEAQEGNYTFEWLDKIMDNLHSIGVGVHLSTPSGARPAWLAQRYPEVLRVNEYGIRNQYGKRHNHCFTSPIYRDKVLKLNTLMAERYQNHPALISWHVSNEYNGECYCDLCLNAFRDWLKKKFDSNLDKLNFEYWSNFWSHTYTDWNQIYPPMKFGDNKVMHGLAIDWKRFITDQTIDFFQNEIKPMRQWTPNIPVTTNFMSWQYFTDLDYAKFAKHVDFISLDSYPQWHNNPSITEENRDISEIEMAYKTSFDYDLCRSFKQQPFLLFECTPSLVNWHQCNSLKRPNLHLAQSLQAISHGSDSVIYFQWRKSRGGHEKFHGAVLSHDANENSRVFKEIQDVGKRLTQMDDIVGSTTIAEVALVYDVEVHWALQEMQGLHNNINDYIDNCVKHYGGLWQQNINMDVVNQEVDFSKYKVVVASTSYLIKPGFAEQVTQFVEKGGIFIATFFSGIVNENDLCFETGNPGPLRKVLGIYAEEIDALNPALTNYVTMNDGRVYEAKLYCELIHSEGAEILARYSSDFYTGMPAITVNHYGKGKAYYIAFNGDKTFVADFYRDIVKQENITQTLPALPQGVVAKTRSDGIYLYIFIINFTAKSYSITLPKSYLDQITDQPITQFSLVPYGYKIMKEKI